MYLKRIPRDLSRGVILFGLLIECLNNQSARLMA